MEWLYLFYSILPILKDGQSAVILNTIFTPLLLLLLWIMDLIEDMTFVFHISLTYKEWPFKYTIEIPEFKKYLNRKTKDCIIFVLNHFLLSIQ